MSIKNVSFLVLALGPKMSRATPISISSSSASTHVTSCSMADHQALLLNLHGQSFQGHHLQQRTTAETQPKSNHDHHYGQNPAKIKSRPPLRPKPSQNQIAIKTQKPTKSQIKSHPPKSKHKTHKTTKIIK